MYLNAFASTASVATPATSLPLGANGAHMHEHRNCADLAVGGDEDEIVTFVCCHEGHDAGIGDNRFSLPRELAERIRNRVG